MPARVYLTEYPNPTGSDDGLHCGWNPREPVSGAGLKHLPGITQAETAWADLTVATALREQTAIAAARHQWRFVTASNLPGQTIGSESQPHGYCAAQSWIVTIPESFIAQQDKYGTMHPNRAGHDLYARAIYANLIADLYPQGPERAPRAPAGDQGDDGSDEGGGTSSGGNDGNHSGGDNEGGTGSGGTGGGAGSDGDTANRNGGGGGGTSGTLLLVLAGCLLARRPWGARTTGDLSLPSTAPAIATGRRRTIVSSATGPSWPCLKFANPILTRSGDRS